MDQKVFRSEILIPVLEASYRDEYTEYKRRNLRCSDAGAAADEGDKCEREIVYDSIMAEKKSLLSSGSLVLFDDGQIHEADIRRRLRLVLRSPERELSDKTTGARGKIDNTADIRKFKTDEITDQLKRMFPAGFVLGDPIVELKSVNEYKYKQMAASGTINQAYYDQVQYYMDLSNTPWTIVLIKNRNSSGNKPGEIPFLEFVVLEDKQRQKEIRAGMMTTKECVEKKILPPRPFLRESVKCQYCRYKHECWPPLADVEKPAQAEIQLEEAPSQEILDGAMRLYAQMGKEIAERTVMLDEAKTIIERYFKATKESELLVDNIKASYSEIKKTGLDKKKLQERISPILYFEVSEPVKKYLEQAIKDRKCDASVLELAMVVKKIYYQLRINEQKAKQERIPRKELKDDKGNKRAKATTAPRTSTPRSKKGKSKGKRVSKRSKLLHNGSKNAGSGPEQGSPKAV
jgi:hypothetical protein